LIENGGVREFRRRSLHKRGKQKMKNIWGTNWRGGVAHKNCGARMADIKRNYAEGKKSFRTRGQRRAVGKCSRNKAVTRGRKTVEDRIKSVR